MINIDVIVIYPAWQDFPVIRSLLQRNRDLFNQVIFSFTHNLVEPDLRKYLKYRHRNFTFVDCNDSINWYHKAMTAAINESNAPYILFLEPDFITNRKFLKKIINQMQKNNYDFICLSQTNRLHLACMLVKREILDKTIKYFGIIENYPLDCFDLFGAELKVLSNGNYKTLEQLGINGYKHLNGLTHNYYLFNTKQYDLIYNKDEFKEYNKLALTYPNIHPYWQSIFELVVDTL